MINDYDHRYDHDVCGGGDDKDKIDIQDLLFAQDIENQEDADHEDDTKMIMRFLIVMNMNDDNDYGDYQEKKHA